ncbi:hypothetical protein F6Q07_02010 [Pectobacterium parmentieri]|uniref:Receptor protein-tyrosine kinase n=1 Tax=Pectobacterium parmentieri TaxID=1905730 RepID=A0A8B3FDX2_PECPM|nr:hypothetical protein [Pectobacterium parmentieri]ACX88309.1 conserved hypothetical protein [Pectobacterium parmentieri WPP163]AOR58436.1 hypothetical protein A8F97_05900 [Pectobacterium parmentieri]AYH01737.1 hypothetical protein C5E26_12770 [Pectobacterium parmentieri]AYH06001.1 hypothetical protein C5E25_11920 [Pectobacterium parmentieri]AYH10554.1 hypothetical protein C5E24_13115 [Pectobacterium parmentieri]
MLSKYNNPPIIKTFYRPIEVAIRWSHLMTSESEILKEFDKNPLFFLHYAAKTWPKLSLNQERVIDGLINGELRHCKRGITRSTPVDLSDPDLSIRHIDLKNWMMSYYPNEKPDFLFSPEEQLTPISININSVQILLTELEVMRIKNTNLEEQRNNIQHDYLSLKAIYTSSMKHPTQPTLGERSESTYLTIIGALISLYNQHSPSGQAYTLFTSQDAVISALIAHYGDKRGVSKSTLESKFAQAKRQLNGA